jgi:nucleotide-binding universal stress UspA family protein
MRSSSERIKMGTAGRLSELSLAGTNQATVRNILLATDFSECSARALDYAVGIASRCKSQLYLFHCIDPAPYSLADPDVVWKTRDDIQRQLEHLVLDLHREGRGRNIEIKVVVEIGEVATLLPQAVKDLDLGLIVVGTHGRTGWRKMVLGSVAESVMDGVSCPVLSVGPSAHRTRIQEVGPENILLVSEASLRSKLAESYAFSLACKYGAGLTVVDVLESQFGRVRAQVSQFKLCGAETATPIPETELENHLQLSPDLGTESDLILQVADRTAVDLIVLAVPETYRFTTRFASTSSYRVVSGAGCPVLTVHAR